MQLTQDNYRLWARALAGLDSSLDDAIIAALAAMEARSIVMEGI